MSAKNILKPQIIIISFILILVFVPFIESKRVLRWEIQRETQNDNIFRNALIGYAEFAERLKADIKETSSSSNESQKKPENIAKKDESLTAIIKTIAKPMPPFKAIIIGDSFIAVAGGIGEILEKELLNYEDITAKRVGKVSSGLSRPDYFDWPEEAKMLILQEKPNIAVIMIGSNDAQSITTLEGNLVENYGSEKWNQEYSKRVSELLDIFAENNTIVFWIGFPVMREKNYSARMANLNSIYRERIKNYEGYYFIPISELFSDKDGDYTAYLPDENGKYLLARQSDGIHLTYFGGEVAVKAVTEKMEEALSLQHK